MGNEQVLEETAGGQGRVGGSTSEEESGRGMLRVKYCGKTARRPRTQHPIHAHRGGDRDKGTFTASVGGGCP